MERSSTPTFRPSGSSQQTMPSSQRFGKQKKQPGFNPLSIITNFLSGLKVDEKFEEVKEKAKEAGEKILAPMSPRGSMANHFDDLDISYITPNLMALGRPWNGQSNHSKNRNNADRLGQCLIQRHDGRFLLWNVSGEPPDPEVSKKLADQVINAEWKTPGGRSQIPSIESVLKICYSIQAWLSVDNCVAGIFCSNGITRTGLVMACFLRFSNQVDSAYEGFKEFSLRRVRRDTGQSLEMDTLPPSLVAFLNNFDGSVELLQYPNPGPLMLRGIALHGVPVEDLPLLDIYDLGPSKVYSSLHEDPSTQEWLDEQGFYKINKEIYGDFVVLCRFGGEGVDADLEDPRTVLFRYVNTSFFLAEGVIELYKGKVDIMPLYIDGIDEDEFQMTLMFSKPEEPSRSLDFEPVLEVLPPFSAEATRKGLLEICTSHTINPELRQLDHLLEQGFPPEAATLALQLGCNNVEEALDFMDALIELLKIQPEGFEDFETPTNEGGFLTPSQSTGGKRTVSSSSSLMAESFDTSTNSNHHRKKNLGTTCFSCGENGVIDKPQLLFCFECSITYHTFCVGEKKIPFTFRHNKDRKHHQAYIQRHYKNWICPDCRPQGVGPTIPKTSLQGIGLDSGKTSPSPLMGAGRPGIKAFRKASGLSSAFETPPHSGPLPSTTGLITSGGSGYFSSMSIDDNDILLSPSSVSRRKTPDMDSYKTPEDGVMVLRRDKSTKQKQRRRSSIGETSTPEMSPVMSSNTSRRGSADVKRQVSTEEALDADILSLVKELKQLGWGKDDLIKMKKMKSPQVSPVKDKQPADAAGEDASSETPKPRLRNSGIAKGAIKGPMQAINSSEKDSRLKTPTPRASGGAKGSLKGPMHAINEAQDVEEQDKPADPRTAMLSALKARGATEQPEEPPADPRAAMLSALKARGATEQPEEPPADPRAAMLSALKARGATEQAEEPPPDPRAAMLSALKARGATEQAEEQEPPPDPRAAMLSALKARGATEQAEEPPPDPRAAMLSALKARGATEQAEEPPPDPRAAMLSALKARGATEQTEEPPPDPRAAMLSALKARGATEQPEESPPDPRAAMLSALKARGATESEEAPADPRAAMLSALKARGAKEEGPPADPRAAMLSALKARGATDTESSSDPKSALLVGIVAKAGGQDDSQAAAPPKEAENPLVTDPKYEKYFKMTKMGIPLGAVKAKMASEGVECDSKVEAALEEYQRKCKEKKEEAEAQAKEASANSDKPKLKDDPTYSTYFRMLKAKVPKEVVKMKMTQNGHDPAILDLDPDGPAPTATAIKGEEKSDKVMLKDHPTYSKYFKMMKVGLPKDVAKHKAMQEGVDTSYLDHDPNEMVPKDLDSAEKDAEKSSASPVKTIPLKDHPKYSKYFKMLKVGLPPPAVKHKMVQEGADPAMLDKDPSFEIPEKEEEAQEPQTGAPKKKKSVKMIKAKDHPDYAKYFKMLKVGLPMGAVRQKAERDGLDPSVVEKDPEALIPESGEEEEAGGDPGEQVPVKDHPVYSKYFKMLKVGLPHPAVKHKMMTDGVNPDVLDKDPDSLHPLDEHKAKAAAAEAKKAKKDEVKIRRKKLYWKALDESEDVNLKDSVWKDFKTDEIKIDEDEFSKLFVSKVSPEEEKKAKTGKKKKEKKDSQGQILDHKRATNTGIAIARIKMSYPEMREAILALDHSVFTAAQLQSLPEYLPNSEESIKLKAYKGDKDKLGEAEKFMMEMLEVTKATKRFQAMMYKKTFIQRKNELLDSIRVLEAACDDVKMSFKLKKLLGIILKLGNMMNQQDAKGFSFDTLLKLNQGKAFDQRTSILGFLIRLVMKNDESLLNFKDDLAHIFPASRVTFDSITSEMKELQEGLVLLEDFKNDSKVKDHKPTKEPPDRLSSSDISQQKTHPVKSDDGVTHFNRVASDDPGDPEDAASLEDFLFRAEFKVNQLKSLNETVVDKFQNVVKYFGQSEQQGPNEFFSTLYSFCKAFDASLEQIRREDAAKARAERIQKAKEERLAAKKGAGGSKAKTKLDLEEAPVPKLRKAQTERMNVRHTMDPQLMAHLQDKPHLEISNSQLQETAKQIAAVSPKPRTPSSSAQSPKNAMLEAIRTRPNNPNKDPDMPPPPPSASQLQAALRSKHSAPPRITANALQDMLQKKASKKKSEESQSSAPTHTRVTASALQAMLQKRASNK